MTSDPTKQSLAQLGVHSPEQVTALFGELRRRFDTENSDLCSLVSDRNRWEALRLSWLGRKAGVLSLVTDNWLKPSPQEFKPLLGQALNELRAHVETVLRELHTATLNQADGVASAAMQAINPMHDPGPAAVEARYGTTQVARGAAFQGIGEQSPLSAIPARPIDLSLPGIERAIGTRHLIRQTFEELQRIFLSIGFSVVEGPEIETPYYNFEALNIPEHHPARDNMDTFYIEGLPAGAGARGGPASPAGRHLLRTHTSPVQIHTMEQQKPPVRIIVPGKVYRRDNPDATHGYMFHQIEGLAVDTDITFCDFKGTVEYFVREFFGPKVKTRLRPSYFPFTEPSAEVDATCLFCGGSGCRVCKQSGWIELFGAGMVNPAVYGFVKYDAERLSGFAFGMGVDRFAMLKYGVTEVPLLFQNDVRFLRQFS
jgi:phenylalanyl-tRNA synthetase alpha chain